MPNLQIVVKKLPKKEGDEQRFAYWRSIPKAPFPSRGQIRENRTRAIRKWT
jgi:hypothetical protein